MGATVNIPIEKLNDLQKLIDELRSGSEVQGQIVRDTALKTKMTRKQEINHLRKTMVLKPKR